MTAAASAPSAADIERALENCVTENVQSPGFVQPVGALVAYRAADGVIDYASANVAELLSIAPATLLGAHIRDALGEATWHEINNAAALPDFASRRAFLGVRRFGEEDFELNGFASGAHIVVEVERRRGEDAPNGALLTQISQLVDRLGDAANETDLMAKAVRLLKAVTGYDRVLAYRFDEEYNGDVIAEDCEPGVEPFLGLRFPSWDIPPQARAIMARLPLRFICDVDQTPSPVIAADPGAQPLDISLALLRSVSPVHLQYLRNMGSAATMTLSVRVEGALWGVISFHHRRARTPTTEIRRICEAIAPYVEARLSVVLKQAELEIGRRIEGLRNDIDENFRSDMKLEEVLPNIAIPIMKAFDAKGFLAVREGRRYRYGETPSPDGVDALIEALRSSPDKIFGTEALAERFPGLFEADEPIAGALIAQAESNHIFAVFRPGQSRTVDWAGAPEKDIVVDGADVRLSPRGSFAVYSQEVRGRSRPWTQSDLIRFRRLTETIVGAAEFHTHVESQTRRHELMIDELNHRVRNILTVIRSIARQSLSGDPSIDRYREALESRIAALAVAHDLGARKASDNASVRSILSVEAAPYAIKDASRIVIRGADCFVQARRATIFALVIHELMTNAAKYGALSVEGGRVEVTLASSSDGLRIEWRESGGPRVETEPRGGFGSDLIRNAIPFELGGAANLTFAPGGLQAELWLPENVLDRGALIAETDESLVSVVSPPPLPTIKVKGAILLLEDNFMLAMDMAKTLRDAGIVDVRIAPNPEVALEIIETGYVRFAILDIDLGDAARQGFDVARRLTAANTPFVFATGYGEEFETPEDVRAMATMTKPVSDDDLLQAARQGLRI